MAITTLNMGLKRWDQPNDIFSYVELSDNFAAIDTHDHTSGKGVQVPTDGLVNLAVTQQKIANLAVGSGQIADLGVITGKINDFAVTTGKLANLAVTSGKIANSSITADKLDPTARAFGQWRPVGWAAFVIPQSSAVGTYWGSLNGVGVTGATGTGMQNFIVYPGDHAVTGLTTNFRVRGLISTGSTDLLTQTLTCGLYGVQQTSGATSTTMNQGLYSNTFIAGTEVSRAGLAALYPASFVGPSFVMVPFSTANQIDIIDPGTNTGGTFKLTVESQQTAAITFNSATPSTNASNTQAALEALANVNPGDVLVNATPEIAIEWRGQYALKRVNLTYQNSLTPNPGTSTLGVTQFAVDPTALPVALAVKVVGAALPAAGPVSCSLRLEVRNV